MTLKYSPNSDVRDESGIGFDSVNSVFKYFISGTSSASVTVSSDFNFAAGSYVAIPHGLNYAPTARVWAELKSGTYALPDQNASSDTDSLSFDFYTDESNLYVRLVYWGAVSITPATYNRNFTYFIQRDRADDTQTESNGLPNSIGLKSSPGDVLSNDGRTLGYTSSTSAFLIRQSGTISIVTSSTGGPFGTPGGSTILVHNIGIPLAFDGFILTAPGSSNVQDYSAQLPVQDTRGVIITNSSNELKIDVATTQPTPQTLFFKYYLYNRALI